jgi:hypothetical protein
MKSFEPLSEQSLARVTGGYGVGQPIKPADWGPWTPISGAKSGFGDWTRRMDAQYPR